MILNKFPKKRTKLSKPYQDIYLKHMFNSRCGNSKVTAMSSRLETWLHKKVSLDVKGTALNQSYNPTLEIGAGTLNHLAYEPLIWPYDIIEPCKELYQDAKALNKIRNIYTDISDLKKTELYQRVISIATFEHILNLPEVVAQASVLLTPKGCLRVAIPNEGTVLWKLGTMVTGFGFKRRYGLDYNVMMAHEHVNTAQEIEEVLKYFFNKMKCQIFGFNKSLAFYRFYICHEPKRELAEQYLS